MYVSTVSEAGPFMISDDTRIAWRWTYYYSKKRKLRDGYIIGYNYWIPDFLAAGDHARKGFAR
jgi:hypothetical protein